MSVVVAIDFAGSINLDPTQFFDSSAGHADATEPECAAEAKAWIEKNGVVAFLREWNLHNDLEVHVGSVQVYP